MTRDEAIALAIEHAKKSPHAYTQGAKTGDWYPHDWVVDAILDAADVGAWEFENPPEPTLTDYLKPFEPKAAK